MHFTYVKFTKTTQLFTCWNISSLNRCILPSVGTTYREHKSVLFGSLPHKFPYVQYEHSLLSSNVCIRFVDKKTNPSSMWLVRQSIHWILTLLTTLFWWLLVEQEISLQNQRRTDQNFQHVRYPPLIVWPINGTWLSSSYSTSSDSLSGLEHSLATAK